MCACIEIGQQLVPVVNECIDMVRLTAGVGCFEEVVQYDPRTLVCFATRFASFS